MNVECFEETLLGFADLVRDIWFEGMRIVFCYPVDKIEDIPLESIDYETYDDDWDHV